MGIAFFSLPTLLKLLCWEAMFLEAAHTFLHELLEQRRLLDPHSSPQSSALQLVLLSPFVQVLPMEPIAFSILCSS